MATTIVRSGFPPYTEHVGQPMNTMRVNTVTGRFRDDVCARRQPLRPALSA